MQNFQFCHFSKQRRCRLIRSIHAKLSTKLTEIQSLLHHAEMQAIPVTSLRESRDELEDYLKMIILMHDNTSDSFDFIQNIVIEAGSEFLHRWIVETGSALLTRLTDLVTATGTTSDAIAGTSSMQGSFPNPDAPESSHRNMTNNGINNVNGNNNNIFINGSNNVINFNLPRPREQ